ncbi:LuxR C-terminal-related transcriptional regulator [Veillonella magna]|uniref:LuxR C-terminal-related transcriptional regulator n=1 Tax=Veillonella magna TaxID=464322 RepID=UPI0026DA7BF3|nr:LuxR C-terminal-related transcriptional regulator [Veillonella magna]
MIKDKDVILALGEKILHSYYEKGDIELLLSHMDDDILFVGGGRSYQLRGYADVSRLFINSQKKFFPCHINNHSFTVKRLDDNTWLYQAIYEVEASSQHLPFLRDYQSCAFVFKRANVVASYWKIIYLNHAWVYRGQTPTRIQTLQRSIRGVDLMERPDNFSNMSESDQRFFKRVIEDRFYSFLDKEDQEFFMAMSLFRSFTLSQAHYMWRHSNTPALLETESEANIFFKFDVQTDSYVFHPALRHYLQQHFTVQPVEWQHKQQHRAARWYLSVGNHEQALNWALKAEDYHTALSAIEMGSPELLRFQPACIRREILDHCSDKLKLQHLRAYLRILFSLFAHNDLELFDTHLATYFKLLNHAELGESTKQELLCYGYCMKAHRAFNDIDESLRWMKKARESLPTSPRPAIAFMYWPYGVPALLSLYHSNPGELTETRDKLEQIINYAIEIVNDPSLKVWGDVLWGEYFYFTGEFDRAAAYFKTVTDTLGEYLIIPGAVITALFYQARILINRGNAHDVKLILNKIQDLLPNTSSTSHMDMVILYEAYLNGILESPESNVQESLHLLNKSLFYYPTQSIVNSIRSRLLLAKKDFVHLQDQAYTTYDLAVEQDNLVIRIYNLLFLAIASLKKDNAFQAKEYVIQAINLAVPDNIITPFAECSEYLSDILSSIFVSSEASQFINRIFHSSFARSLQHIRRDIAPSALSRLSTREREVGSFVAQGWTNKDIAKHLSVAEITVKKTISRIFQKLNVSNRAALTRYWLDHKHN